MLTVHHLKELSHLRNVTKSRIDYIMYMIEKQF